MNKYAIAFDIGGVFIKSAVLNYEGQVCPDTVAIYPSFSKLGKSDIIDHLVEIIKQQTGRILDKYIQIYGIGYAFPGPFDYENGISYITGLDKFDQIYGVNMRIEISERLRSDTMFSGKQAPEFQIVFENDANLFGLGELLSGKARGYRRSICITIGTGAGSAFIDNGEIVTKRADVPPNGWIYNTPFGDSIVDDYISKRGILRLAKQSGMDTGELDVKALAESARGGDQTAASVFWQFGRNIGVMLNGFVRSYHPEAVILGGQISKSSDLFMDGIFESLENSDLKIEMTADTSISTFAGVSRLLQLNVDRKP